MKRRITFIPIAISLMLFPSLIYSVVLDGGDSEYYGFPLPWNSRFLAASLVKDVYVIPLLVDVVFYGIVAFLVWKWLQPRIGRLPKIPATVLPICVWLWGSLCSLALVLVIFFQPPVFRVWYVDEWLRIISIRVGLGV